MNEELTVTEQKFYELLKKKLRFTSIEIRTKISLYDLCKERHDVIFTFGNDYKLIEGVIIDFVLYRKDKVIAGIEVVDEPEEMNLKKGEEMLINTIFSRLDYKFFRIVDTNKLKEAVKIIKQKL